MHFFSFPQFQQTLLIDIVESIFLIVVSATLSQLSVPEAVLLIYDTIHIDALPDSARFAKLIVAGRYSHPGKAYPVSDQVPIEAIHVLDIQNIDNDRGILIRVG